MKIEIIDKNIALAYKNRKLIDEYFHGNDNNIHNDLVNFIMLKLPPAMDLSKMTYTGFNFLMTKYYLQYMISII